MILLDLPGRPIPFKSPHVGAHRSFNPRYHEMKQVKQEILNQYHGDIISGALSMECTFYFQVPKSFSKKKKEQALKGEIYPITRPDRSNCLKFLEDCLIGTVVLDDSMFVDGCIRKRYCSKDHTLIKICFMNKEDQNG